MIPFLSRLWYTGEKREVNHMIKISSIQEIYQNLNVSFINLSEQSVSADCSLIKG